MQSSLKALIGAGLCIAFFITSCKKDNSDEAITVNEEEAAVISQENTAAEAEYDDAAEIGLAAGADLEVALRPATHAGGANPGAQPELFADLYFKIGPCVTITVSPNDTTFPKTVTIDYGSGCICRDGKFRKGAILLHYTAPLRRAGAVLTITFRDYYVNRKHLEGIKTITNLSAEGAVIYSVQVQDGKISWPNGRGLAYAGIKTFTQVQGMDTRTVRDDVYTIEGRAETTYANGITVVRHTATPLVKPVACHWIVAGVLTIKINNAVFYIDFGTGGCDNKALFTNVQLNKTTEITLP